MPLTAFAAWLNSFFGGFDQSVAEFAFSLHSGGAGAFFDRFFPAVTLLGEKGLFFIALGLLLVALRRSRRAGTTLLFSLILGLLFTNLLLKNFIARPRPYADELSQFFLWWQEIGSGVENEIYSFPSGHATASFAAMTALFWCGDKRYSWCSFLLAALVGFSRIYLVVHYASDILGGALVGFIAGTLSYWLIGLAWKRLEPRFSWLRPAADAAEKRPTEEPTACRP